MRSTALASSAAILLLACSSTPSTPTAANAPPAAQQDSEFGAPEKILFWTPEQQLAGYRNIDRIYPTRTVDAGDRPNVLKQDSTRAAAIAGVRYDVDGQTFDVDGFVEHNHVVGLLVLKNDQILLERYDRRNDENSKWISFSVTKSIVSLLIGAAIADGHIKAVTDPVTTYLPRLVGTSYEGVTIENVLHMASGVKWNEDYADPESDVGKTARFTADQHIEYLASQPRVAEAGTSFNYNTGETHLVGAVLRAATKRDLATYLAEKIWKPMGMESSATWPTLEPNGAEHGGCCLSATLRDYARVGQFTLAHGRLASGKAVLPEGWMKRSTTPSKAYPGYGYLWWLDRGTYAAVGIFGQAIWVSPADNLVIVTHSMWPKATGPAFSAHRSGFFGAVAAALR